MPGVLAPVSYEPMQAVRMMGSQGATPSMRREAEDALQTFKRGVPLILVAGFLQEATFLAPQIVYGISGEPGHNLAVAGTPQQLSEGTPQNQPSAVTTPVGAWPRDGKMGAYLANGQNVFSIALKAGQVFTQALMVAGTLYGLVKDASGYWYLDNTDTVGDNAVAVLLGLDDSSPNTATGGSRVFIQIAASKRYFA